MSNKKIFLKIKYTDVNKIIKLRTINTKKNLLLYMFLYENVNKNNTAKKIIIRGRTLNQERELIIMIILMILNFKNFVKRVNRFFYKNIAIFLN